MFQNLPPKGARIVVAMSGGVDSSVAAGWLKHAGYDVIGISLQLHDMAENEDDKYGSCCSLSDLSDARRVAETLDIPFYVMDMEKEFDKAVIDDFVSEYQKGRTPNPCVRCNEKVKFRKLMDWALDLGADYLATGHYAGIRKNEETGEYELLKGEDPAKDQSYFLFTMKQEDLKRSLFPVGTFVKTHVRDLAKEYGLTKVAGKPDSQEICFVQSKSYKDFVESKVDTSELKSGPMLNLKGEEVGRHSGIHGFTIGQRKGLGVNSLEPLYVIGIDAEKNAVYVGPESALFRKRAIVSHLNWLATPELGAANKYDAKIRYRSKESPVIIHPHEGNRVSVEFMVPQRAITPGQAMVFYQGDKVVGGGWIEDLPIAQEYAHSV